MVAPDREAEGVATELLGQPRQLLDHLAHVLHGRGGRGAEVQGERAQVMAVGDHVAARAKCEGTFVALAEAFDPAEIDHMVATRVGRHIAAFEVSHRAVEQGYITEPIAVGDAAELVVLGLGEVVGNGDLVFGEDVDGEVFAVAEGGVAAGGQRLAPEYQRRIEGDRTEGVRRHAEGLALGIPRGDDGDAGHEAAQHVAQLALVERGGSGGHGGSPAATRLVGKRV
ncbi:hypothetical protein D9M71_558290 [compost metagenome]